MAKNERRQQRAVRNDQRILDAAVELLAEEGWGGFALATVAPRAGLSKRPVVDRFADRQALANAIWRERVVPVLLPALERVVAGPAMMHPDELIEAMEPFRQPDAVMACAAELLVVRGFESRVRRTVDNSLRSFLEERTVPKAGRLTKADAARQAYVLIVAFGLLAVSKGPYAEVPSIEPELKAISVALAAMSKPVRLPSASASYLEEGFVFDTDDEPLNKLLQVVLEQVGERGFDGATMSRITKAAGVTEGFIFGRYKTKTDLFIDASDRSFVNNARLNHEFMQRIDAAANPGLGEAVMIREFMRPGRELLRMINLEQFRLARHNLAMGQVMQRRLEEFLDAVGGSDSQLGSNSVYAGRFHAALATGTGAPLLALLQPDAWTLPYDVVTIPLDDSLAI